MTGNITNTYLYWCLNEIPVGSNVGQRVGMEFYAKGVAFNLSINGNDSTTQPYRIKMGVVKKFDNNKALPVTSEIWETPSEFQTWRNRAYAKKYKILWMRTFMFNNPEAEGRDDLDVKFYLPLGMAKCKNDGNVGSYGEITQNGYYFFTYTDEATNFPVFDSQSKFRFFYYD